MKHILLISLLGLIQTASAQLGSITNTFPDTINLNQKLRVEVRSLVEDNGAPPSFCSPLIEVIDSLNSNQITIDLTFDFTGGGTPNPCIRLDTLEYALLPQGSYQLICFWNRVDSTVLPPQNFARYTSDTLNFHVVNSTSLSEVDHSKLTVSPNPASNQVFISNPNNINFERIELWSLRGQLVKEINHLEQAIDISNLSKGVYIFKFIGNSFSHKKKMVKF